MYLDGVVLKRSWGGDVRNLSMLVAIGVEADGYRQIFGVAEGAKEDKAGWSLFLEHLKGRGLTGVQLVISDACMGLVKSVSEHFPDAQWQRCTVHLYRNIFSHVPPGKVRAVARMLKAIHASEDLTAAHDKERAVIERLNEMRLSKAASLVESMLTRLWFITASRLSTGGVSGPTIRSSGLFGRFGDGRGLSARSPMESPH